VWIYTSILPVRLHGVVLRWKKSTRTTLPYHSFILLSS
jgi:hypothetical protein